MIPEENPLISPSPRRPPSVTSPTLSLPGYRQSSEPPVHPRYQHQMHPNFAREQRKERHFDERSQDSYRSDGRPPSGRAGSSRNDRPSLPNKFDSLPPRLKKKYEEERLLQTDRIPAVASNSGPAKTEWDGGTRTFVNVTGALPVRPSLPPPFPSSSHPANIRPGSGGGKPLRGHGRHQPVNSGVASRFIKTLPLSDQAEDSDPIHVPVRPRSQDSMSFSDHGRERKTSVTDSRSSTPLSNVDSSSGMQLHGRGTLRRLEEVISATQTSLDWSEEMEEEDKRSLAGKRCNQPPPVVSGLATKQPEVVFACTDIRYKNKPIQGYCVIPTSSANGVEGQTSAPSAGRPLLGQGSKQDVTAHPPARMSVPGLIQLPVGPPPSELNRLSSSPRRADVVSHPAESSYDRSSIPRQDHNRGDVAGRSYPRKAGPMQQRTLFDPANPHRPIVVASRGGDDGMANGQQQSALGCPEMTFLTIPADQGNNMSSRPAWYDPQSEK